MDNFLQKRRVLIAIGGGISAYKVCEVISQLFQEGAEVRVILTDKAEQFITPLTVTTLSRHPAYTDDCFWQPIHSRPVHIELAEWAELLVIAPLTANTLAKCVYGLADNLLTNTILASRCPILVVPAMNTEMWEQFSVKKNWELLQENQRFYSIDPHSGLLACDTIGQGRMAEPTEILAMIHSLLITQGKRDLKGKNILISGGGTKEYFDTVRYLGNPSTGKMGIALVQACCHRGGNVTFIHAPIDEHLLRQIPQVLRISVVNSAEMRQAMLARFSQADWVLMGAAVADVKPATYIPEKVPKKLLPTSIPLEPVGDIVEKLGMMKQPHQTLLGFAAQSGDIMKPALEKLVAKNLDFMVANPIDKHGSGFGSDTNQAILLDRKGHHQTVELCSKLELAHQIIDFMQASNPE